MLRQSAKRLHHRTHFTDAALKVGDMGFGKTLNFA
jgi:hypothetical protein